MAKCGRSAGTIEFSSPPPSPLGPANTLDATYYRAMHVPSLPVTRPSVDSPDAIAIARRLAADIGSLPARWQPLRSAGKRRTR